MIFQRLRLWLHALFRSAAGTPRAGDATILPDQVAAALANLSMRSRTVFRLHACDQLTYAEIAEKLGCSLADVEHHLADALQALDRHIGEISADCPVAPRNERG